MADRRLFVQQVVTTIVNRAARVAHRLVGFGAATPPAPSYKEDPAMWAELAGELRLREFTKQPS